MRLVRIRCDLANYGMVEDLATARVLTVDIDNGLSAWPDGFAAFVNREVECRGATVKGIVRVALTVVLCPGTRAEAEA